jgi:hypothetical protein
MSTTSELSPQVDAPKRPLLFYAPWALFIILFIALFGLVFPVLSYAVAGWLNPAALGIHLVHDTMASTLLWVALIGMLVQARNPQAHIGGMAQALLVFLVMCLTIIASAFFFPPPFIFLLLALITAALHPARRELLSWRGIRNPLLAGLTAVAAVPSLIYAVEHIARQRTAVAQDPHAEMGHWLLMAAYAITIIVLGLFSATRPPGWRVTAWSTGVMAAVFGLISLLYPAQSSSLGVTWGLLALIWGVLFVAVAELFGGEA